MKSRFYNILFLLFLVNECKYPPGTDKLVKESEFINQFYWKFQGADCKSFLQEFSDCKKCIFSFERHYIVKDAIQGVLVIEQIETNQKILATYSMFPYKDGKEFDFILFFHEQDSTTNPNIKLLHSRLFLKNENDKILTVRAKDDDIYFYLEKQGAKSKRNK